MNNELLPTNMSTTLPQQVYIIQFLIIVQLVGACWNIIA